MEQSMNLDQLCEDVCRVCREVGRFIALEQKRLTQNGIEAKGTNDFVTYVDKASETLLVTELQALLPGSSFITEENTVKHAEKDDHMVWIIDPIDGTTNFIHGIPLFSISVALMINKKLVLGVIYEISRDECFYATENLGARLNGSSIKVSGIQKVSDSLLVTGFPYRLGDMLDDWMELFKHFLKNSHGVRRLGSAAIDLAYVACGRFEAFYEYGLSPWDVAAGVFIVEQAGGKTTDFKGEDNYIFGRQLVSTNGNIHAELLTALQEKLKVAELDWTK
jgi:myo-inositol-1(or 4)-monophosphatase